MTLTNSGISNVRNVSRYVFGQGMIGKLGDLLSPRRESSGRQVIFLVDQFFEENPVPLGSLPLEGNDQLIYVATQDEPTTGGIDMLTEQVKADGGGASCAVIGIGGGITLDTAKAVSNLLANNGKATDYQGWDLVPEPGVYKIGIPTLSGTGAEATRTCVMIHKETGLKLGMNSAHTVFDQLILDPNLTATVPRDQYFVSGMDTWVHCVESLNGSYRNPVGDAFSHQAISLCREVFSSANMMNDGNRAKLMVASYLGGCAIATNYVGVVHPFSAGLSVVLGLHHCVANCIAMMAMEPFYPREFGEFMGFVENNTIELPRGVCAELSEDVFDALYQATVVHEKPLTNALGTKYRQVLTPERVRAIFEAM